MTIDPRTDRPRALHLLEAADFLRDAHFRDGLSVREIGTALRHMADAADPMVGSLARDGFGLDEIAAMPAAPVTVPPADRAGLRERIIEALYEARRPGLGGMTEADAVAYMADAVLSVLPETARLHDEILTLQADQAKMRDLLRSENERADSAIDRETTAEEAEEEHRLALSTALGLGTSAPWDAIRERAAELAGQPAPVDQAAVLRGEAARIRAHCPDHLDSDSAEGAWLACHCAVADDMLRRLAAETQPTEADRCPHGCDVSICPCLACEATTDEEDAPRREPHPTEADLRHALAVAAKFHGRDTGASVDPAASRTTEYRHTCHDQTSAPGRDYECQWCSTLPASLPAVVAEPGKEA